VWFMLSKTKRLSCFYLLYIIVSIFLSLFFGEIYLRSFKPYLAYPFHLVPSNKFNHAYVARGIFQGKIGQDRWIIKTNNLGYREEKITINKRDKFRIIVLGDSFIAGNAVTIPDIVEKSLSNFRTIGGKEIEVINAGVPTYSATIHLARFLHETQWLQPDAVILFPDLTDVYDDWHRYRKLVYYDNNGNFSVSRSKKIEEIWKNWSAYKDAYPVLSNLLLFRLLNLKLGGLLNGSAKDQSEPSDFADEKKYIFEHARAGPTEIERFMPQIKYSIRKIKQLSEVVRQSGAHFSIMMYLHQPQLAPENQTDFRNFSGIDHEFNRVYEFRIQAFSNKSGVPYLFCLRRYQGKIR